MGLLAMSPLLLLAALAASVSALPPAPAFLPQPLQDLLNNQDFQQQLQNLIQQQLQQQQQAGQLPLPFQLMQALGLFTNDQVATGRSGETKKHWGGYGGGKWNNWNKPSYGNYGNYGNYNPFAFYNPYAAYYNPYAAYGGVPYTGTIGTITGATSAAGTTTGTVITTAAPLPVRTEEEQQ